MTDAIDKVSIKWTKPIAKLTGGYILGDKDPISKMLGVDQKSIQERLDGQKTPKPQKQKVLADPFKPRSKAGQARMEADKDTRRSRVIAGGIALANPDRGLLATGGKGRRAGAGKKLTGE